MQWYAASSSSDLTGTFEEVTFHQLQLSRLQDKTHWLRMTHCGFCLSCTSGKLNFSKEVQLLERKQQSTWQIAWATWSVSADLTIYINLVVFISSRILASCYQQVSQYRLSVIVPLASPSPANSTGHGWQHSFQCGLVQLYVLPAINQCGAVNCNIAWS